MIVGELIDLYRTKHNLSLEELSAQIGVDRNILHRLEKGSTASSKYVPTLISWLFSPPKPYGKSKQTPNPSS